MPTKISSYSILLHQWPKFCKEAQIVTMRTCRQHRMMATNYYVIWPEWKMFVNWKDYEQLTLERKTSWVWLHEESYEEIHSEQQRPFLILVSNYELRWLYSTVKIDLSSCYLSTLSSSSQKCWNSSRSWVSGYER